MVRSITQPTAPYHSHSYSGHQPYRRSPRYLPSPIPIARLILYGPAGEASRLPPRSIPFSLAASYLPIGEGVPTHPFGAPTPSAPSRVSSYFFFPFSLIQHSKSIYWGPGRQGLSRGPDHPRRIQIESEDESNEIILIWIILCKWTTHFIPIRFRKRWYRSEISLGRPPGTSAPPKKSFSFFFFPFSFFPSSFLSLLFFGGPTCNHCHRQLRYVRRHIVCWGSLG